MKKSDILDEHFMGARSRLLDIAAFLDRLERSSGNEDYRAASFKSCLHVLSNDTKQKTRQILEMLSDQTNEPIQKALGKSASGAWPDFKNSG